jgi:excisionase family DNA binding protein
MCAGYLRRRHSKRQTLERVTEGLLTTREVAALLRVSSETALRWHRSGKLPGGRRLGSNVLRFDRGEVETWLDGTRESTLVSVEQGSYDRSHA